MKITCWDVDSIHSYNIHIQCWYLSSKSPTLYLKRLTRQKSALHCTCRKAAYKTCSSMIYIYKTYMQSPVERLQSPSLHPQFYLYIIILHQINIFKKFKQSILFYHHPFIQVLDLSKLWDDVLLMNLDVSYQSVVSGTRPKKALRRFSSISELIVFNQIPLYVSAGSLLALCTT